MPPTPPHKTKQKAAAARKAAAANGGASTSAPPPPDTQTLEVPAGSVVMTPDDIREMTDSIIGKVREELAATPPAQGLATSTPAAAPAAPTGNLAAPPEPTAEDLERAVERDRAIRAMMPERAHLENCPVAGTDLGRIEVYPGRRPPRPHLGEPAKDLTVVRCVECGETRVHEGDLNHHGL